VVKYHENSILRIQIHYYHPMATKSNTTTALILATFALVGIMTTGAVAPAAFAQTVTDDPLAGTGLSDLLGDQTATDSNGGSGDSSSTSITDEVETEEESTTQAEDQSESNIQSNSIDQDQTGAINEEIASGENSETASAAQSDSESEYETKYKSKGGSSTLPIPGTSTSTSDSVSGVSNNGTVGQEQSLSSPVQVNTNNGGNDESRSAVVGFDLGFEQFSTQESSVPGIGTSLPIIIPSG
jgi:hypothetical protein